MNTLYLLMMLAVLSVLTHAGTIVAVMTDYFEEREYRRKRRQFTRVRNFQYTLGRLGLDPQWEQIVFSPLFKTRHRGSLIHLQQRFQSIGQAINNIVSLLDLDDD